MADKKAVISLDVQANLTRLDEAIRKAEALKTAASGSTTMNIKAKVVVEGADKLERTEARRAAAVQKTDRVVERSMRVDRQKAEAFITQRSEAVNILNAAQNQKPGIRQSIYARGGLSPNLAAEAESLRILRQRHTLLREITSAAQRNNADDANDALFRYNKINEAKHRLDPNLDVAELDFQAYNKWLSLGRQVGQREDRFAYRLARDRGVLPDKSNLTNVEIDSRVLQMIRRVGVDQQQGGITNVDALVRSMATVHRGDVPLHIQEAELNKKLVVTNTPTPEFSSEAYLARLEERAATRTALYQPEVKIPGYKRALAALRRTLKDKRGFALNPFASPDIPTPELDAALELIKQQQINPFASPEMEKIAARYGRGGTEKLKAVGGREFEVTGTLPPVRTTAYPPTIAEMHRGISQQQLDRERAAAGLLNAPPLTATDVSRPRSQFYLPERDLYGPEIISSPGPLRDARGRFVKRIPIVGSASAALGTFNPITNGIPNFNARLPTDWAGGGGGPPVNLFGQPAAGFGGDAGGAGGAAGGRGSGGGIFGRFGSLLKYSIAAAVIYPIFTSITNTVQKAIELEVIMKRIQGIYGGRTLGDQLAIKAEIAGTARELGSDLLETARTAQLLAQEQIPISKLAENLRAIAQGAVGLGIAQEGLANFVIAVRNVTGGDDRAKQIEGPELVNLLAAFVRRGAVSPQNLMTSIQQILPSLEPFATNVSEVNDPAFIGAITEVIARRSNFTGTQVANSLKFMIAKLGRPIEAREIERRSGINLGTAESGGQELRPFIEIMQDLANSYQNLIATGQTAAAQSLLSDLFGARQAGVGAALMKNLTLALEDGKTAIANSAAAAELATLQQDTWQKTVERLSTSFTLFVGTLWEGSKTIVGPVLNNIATFFDNLDYSIHKTIQSLKDLGDWGEKVLEGGKLGNYAAAAALSYGAVGPLPQRAQVPSTAPNIFNRMFTPEEAANAPTVNDLGENGTGKGIVTTPGVPLYSDVDWRAFFNQHEKAIHLMAGQERAARDFGAAFYDPRKSVSGLTDEIERFYQAIDITRIQPNEKIPDFIARITEQDVATAKEMLAVFDELQRAIPPALRLERNRLESVSAITQGGRVEDAQARALSQTNRVRRRLARTFGRKGLEEFPIQTMRDELEEISQGRLFDIDRENIAYKLRLKLLQQSLEFQKKPTELRAAELTALEQEHQANLEIFDINTKELQVQTEINSIYESRLIDLKEIETLSQSINSTIQSAFQGLPGLTRSRGVFGKFLGSLITPLTGTLFKNVTEQLKLTGKGGLFPGIGEAVNKIVGPPSLTYDLGDTISNFGYGPVVQNVGQKSPEQLKKEQKAAQIRALEIAIAATLGSAAGKGGPGAQVGGQIGAIGGFALGAKLGTVGGPLGALAGGLIGGLLGGLFDKPKKKEPELVALEIISRNTGEQVTLLENTNRLLELQNLAFNVPTGFTLPKFNPSNFGGQNLTTGGVSNEINVSVNIGGSSSSAQEIGTVVAQAVAERMQSEYSSSGRYVSRRL